MDGWGSGRDCHADPRVATPGCEATCDIPIVVHLISGSWSALTPHVAPRIVTACSGFHDGSATMGSRAATRTTLGKAANGAAAGRAAERAGRAGDDVDPAFHRAILKIALELKKADAPGYEAIVERTIASMKLDAARFRRYLGENGARNMSLLLATARTIGT
jgi:hypothetical protein